MEQYYTPPPGGGDRAAARRAVKERARELLGKNGNRLSFIGAALFFTLMLIAVGTITAALWYPLAPLLEGYPLIYDNLYGISVLIDYILIFLFVLPAGLGLFTLVHRMREGEKAAPADVFFAYRRLPRTWLVALLSSLPALIVAGAVSGAGRLVSVAAGLELVRVAEPVGALINLCIVLTAAAVCVGALALAVRLFFFPGLAMRGDMSVGAALAASFSASSGRFFEICGFVFSFAGWAALSLVTLGVLFILQLAPYYFTSYMIYCGRIKGDLTHE